MHKIYPCLAFKNIFLGALIVTTPQKVALADAAKGINMFQKVCRLYCLSKRYLPNL